MSVKCSKYCSAFNFLFFFLVEFRGRNLMNLSKALSIPVAEARSPFYGANIVSKSSVIFVMNFTITPSPIGSGRGIVPSESSDERC